MNHTGVPVDCVHQSLGSFPLRYICKHLIDNNLTFDTKRGCGRYYLRTIRMPPPSPLTLLSPPSSTALRLIIYLCLLIIASMRSAAKLRVFMSTILEWSHNVIFQPISVTVRSKISSILWLVLFYSFLWSL